MHTLFLIILKLMQVKTYFNSKNNKIFLAIKD